MLLFISRSSVITIQFTHGTITYPAIRNRFSTGWIPETTTCSYDQHKRADQPESLPFDIHASMLYLLQTNQPVAVCQGFFSLFGNFFQMCTIIETDPLSFNSLHIAFLFFHRIKIAVKLYQLYRLSYRCFNDGCFIFKLTSRDFVNQYFLQKFICILTHQYQF